MELYSGTVYINKKIKYELLFSATEKSQQDLTGQFYIEVTVPFKKKLQLTVDTITKQKVYSPEEH